MSYYSSEFTSHEIAELVRQNEQYRILIDAIFDKAKLSTGSREELYISGYDVGDILKLLVPKKYQSTVDRLRYQEKEVDIDA